MADASSIGSPEKTAEIMENLTNELENIENNLKQRGVSQNAINEINRRIEEVILPNLEEIEHLGHLEKDIVAAHNNPSQRSRIKKDVKQREGISLEELEQDENNVFQKFENDLGQIDQAIQEIVALTKKELEGVNNADEVIQKIEQDEGKLQEGVQRLRKMQEKLEEIDSGERTLG